MATGVLLTGFGGPDCLDSVGPFMCNLMGREPSDELVERAQHKYLAIGGSSPLAGIADGVANELRHALVAEGHADVPVAVGMRYWHPYITDALAALKEAGCDRVVTVSLSPFESKVAHGAYREAIGEAVEALGELDVVEAPLVSTLKDFIDFFDGAVATALEDMESSEGAVLAFTAHSLPESDLVEDDPYVSGLERVAERVAVDLGLETGSHGPKQMLQGLDAFGSDAAPRAWFLVYQSKGNRPGAWLGPTIEELIDAAAQSGVPAVVVVPIGFMTDHMETMYDLDIVAADYALQAGLEFMRVPVPNQEDFFVEGIAKMVAPLL